MDGQTFVTHLFSLLHVSWRGKGQPVFVSNPALNCFLFPSNTNLKHKDSSEDTPLSSSSSSSFWQQLFDVKSFDNRWSIFVCCTASERTWDTLPDVVIIYKVFSPLFSWSLRGPRVSVPLVRVKGQLEFFFSVDLVSRGVFPQKCVNTSFGSRDTRLRHHLAQRSNSPRDICSRCA